jgi:tetratricopeptide (TPR) repeat protein
MLLNLGEYQASIAAYEALLTLQPASAETWMFYGYVLATAGRLAEAIPAYRKAIALKPDFGEAYWSLANLKTFRFDSSELTAMGDVLKRIDLAPRSRAQLHFAFGKALEDAKNYSASFEQYRQGNAVWRKHVSHSADGVSAFVRRSKALFTREQTLAAKCLIRFSSSACPDPARRSSSRFFPAIPWLRARAS